MENWWRLIKSIAYEKYLVQGVSAEMPIRELIVLQID